MGLVLVPYPAVFSPWCARALELTKHWPCIGVTVLHLKRSFHDISPQTG